MKCITRYKIKFGDIVIPERTECTIIGNKKPYYANLEGEKINIIVHNINLNLDIKENENKVIEYRSNVNKAFLLGLYVSTNTQSVYIYPDTYLYKDYDIFYSELEDIFGKESIPEILQNKKNPFNPRYIKLFDLIDYFEDEFNKWADKNCEFRVITKEDVDNFSIDKYDIGNKILTDKGYKQFKDKKIEYQNKLEKTGFTYDFSGGLYWNK